MSRALAKPDSRVPMRPPAHSGYHGVISLAFARSSLTLLCSTILEGSIIHNTRRQHNSRRQHDTRWQDNNTQQQHNIRQQHNTRRQHNTRQQHTTGRQRNTTLDGSSLSSVSGWLACLPGDHGFATLSRRIGNIDLHFQIISV